LTVEVLAMYHNAFSIHFKETQYYEQSHSTTYTTLFSVLELMVPGSHRRNCWGSVTCYSLVKNSLWLEFWALSTNSGSKISIKFWRQHLPLPSCRMEKRENLFWYAPVQGLSPAPLYLSPLHLKKEADLASKMLCVFFLAWYNQQFPDPTITILWGKKKVQAGFVLCVFFLGDFAVIWLENLRHASN